MEISDASGGKLAFYGKPDPISVKYLDSEGKEQTTNALVVAASDKRVTWKAGWYVVKGEVTVKGGADCNGDVYLILADTGKLTISGVVDDNAGIKVSGPGNSLTIYGQALGTGALTVTGGDWGAGIGGGNESAGSNITINGGTVTATGGQSGAGIGGGYYASGSNITINAGMVTANGASAGAGIGGGNCGDGSNITINGGEVMATGDGGAGVGGGGGGAGSNITINGGTVTAVGGDSAAGIGGGENEPGSYITINGGKVTATGGGSDGEVGAGIGGGCEGTGSYIWINGGTVTATGGDGGAGIGNGSESEESASDIYAADDVIVKAGAKANPTDQIAHLGTQDIAGDLTGKQYVTAEKVPPPRTPDYAEATGKDWLYNHAIAGKACPDEAAESDVDLFYVYPTLVGNEQVVIDGFRGIDDETMRSFELSTMTAAGAFDATGRCFADMMHVYAPFYRQATLDTATDCSTNASGEVVANANAKYLAKLCEGPAYGDVTNALTTYFAKWNNGRKLVLAAHSQGSAVLRLVMENYFTLPENQDKAKHIICSYQIGFGIGQSSIDKITTANGMTFAEKADDTNVIVSYNTMGEDASGNSVLLPPDTLAINPITWTRSTDLAEKDLNLGALTSAIGAADVIATHLYGAQVANTGANRGQVVFCKELNGKVLEPCLFGTGSLHTYDYGAYWENLRANVYDRGGNLAGFAKLCTTNFPKHLCVSKATVMFEDKSSYEVNPVGGTVWIPTNNLVIATVLLVPEKGYRLMFNEKERESVAPSISSKNLQSNGELLISTTAFSAIKVEWVQRKPDYADETGKDWLFNHDIAAKRYEGEPAEDPGVDLFYFYPTSVIKSDDHVVDGVCDIEDAVLRGPSGALNSWNLTAKVFGDITHVYAPYYRQTPSDVEKPIGAQPDANANMRQYWYTRAPYEDATNALTHYFTKINPDGKRPFIFAGHSHGAGMLSLVMEHFFAEDPTRKAWLKNMVACYALGWGVSKEWEAKLSKDLDINVATNATDAGVYVFWNIYGPNTNAIETILYPDPAASAAAVNPILWTREKDAYAPASLNLGGYTADGSGAVKPGLYDASNNVANGTIICTSKAMEKQYLEPSRMFGEHSLHLWDYMLYWENIRANALQRIKTLTDRIPLAGTAIDYADPFNWVTNTGTAKPLDVLYVYPTIMLEGDTTVVPVTDAMKGKAYTNAYVGAASAFADYANVLIPAYRQLNMAAVTAAQALYTEPRDFVDYLKGGLPRTDLFAALDYYFTNLNANATRPFILAGHSQGSAMLKIAFEDYFRSNTTRKDYLKKMVATYGLGYSFAPDWFAAYYPDKDLTFATNATDAAVVVSWNTEGPNAQGRSFVIENGALAINPMTWTAATDVWSETIPDAMIQLRTATDYTYAPDTYALVTTNSTAYLDPTMGFGEKSLHGEDWSLWYDQVKNNGFTRYAAFADLKEVSTDNIPTVADTTWKIEVSPDGKTWAEAIKGPDGAYYIDGTMEKRKARVTYNVNPEKAAENFIFPNGTTTTYFSMGCDKKTGKWMPLQPVADILEATKVGKPTLKLGAVAQRYPWNGIVDVNYKAMFWPKEGALGAVEVTVGESVTTNDIVIVGSGTVTGTTAIEMPAETKGQARFRAVVK